MTHKDYPRLAEAGPPGRAAGDTLDYLEGISQQAGLRDLRLSKSMAIYSISHAVLGVEYPTITGGFTNYLCGRLANGVLAGANNILTLELMISEHSVWIANLVRDNKAISSDSLAGIDVAEYEAEVAGYPMDDAPDEAETAMTVKHRRQRYR
jgi:hypothetical protein